MHFRVYTQYFVKSIQAGGLLLYAGRRNAILSVLFAIYFEKNPDIIVNVNKIKRSKDRIYV